MPNSLKSLLPCPFCGSENIDAEGWASTDSAGPACDDCGASAGGVKGSLQDNIAAWNTRSGEEAMLRESLNQIASALVCEPELDAMLHQIDHLNGDTEPHASGIPVTGALRGTPPPSYQRQDNPAIPAFSPNYERMFMGAVEMLAEVSVALGIPDDVAECANGNAEMLEAIAELKAAATPTAAIESLSRQGGDSKVGAMDLSAPPRVWLQIDTNGDDECRDEPILESNWGDLTWCYESIGGQEVVYIRQDLAPTRASEAGDCLSCCKVGEREGVLVCQACERASYPKDGYVLVPRECTTEMELVLSDALATGDYSIAECLDKAIAAAPAPGGGA